MKRNQNLALTVAHNTVSRQDLYMLIVALSVAPETPKIRTFNLTGQMHYVESKEVLTYAQLSRKWFKLFQQSPLSLLALQPCSVGRVILCTMQ